MMGHFKPQQTTLDNPNLRKYRVNYYLPRIYLQRFAKIRPTFANKDLTFSEILEEAVTKQLMIDFNLLTHFNHENNGELKTNSTILTSSLLCERCLMISAENPRVSQIKVGEKMMCEICALWEVREILAQLLQKHAYSHSMLRRTFDFLSPEFFSSLVIEHINSEHYEQTNTSNLEH